ncbi:MAG: aldo/keto reductase, partial [Anaerolineae bacterium]|nr:aldo/keto reductase [Anaerolineae bacterium]
TAADFSALAVRHGHHPVSLAVAWAAANPDVTCPIVGARSLTQLQPSLAALESEHLRNQIYSKTRQLHKLEENAAQLGLHTPPHVGIQIEDLQVEIAELKRKLAALGDASG